MIKKKCKECGTLIDLHAQEYCEVCHGNYGWWYTCDKHEDIIFRDEVKECPVCRAEDHSVVKSFDDPPTASEASSIIKAKYHHEVTTNLASRWKRLGGSLIDSLISSIIVCPIMFATGDFQQWADGQQMTIGQAAIYFIIGWVLFLIFHGYLLITRGQTIGKVLVQTKIVDLNGNLPNFGKLLFLRYLVLGIIYQIPILGSIAVFANALFIFGGERRCIHDYLAGTRVIDV